MVFTTPQNSIATVVATRVLSPGVAVVWAAFFNFIAVVVFGTAVAKTVGGDMVDITKIPAQDQLYVLLAGVMEPIFWNLITWYFGLPTSSSHALVGAYAGSALTSFVWHFGTTDMLTVLKPEGWIKTLTFIVLSPTIGMVLGYFLMIAVYWIFKRCRFERSTGAFASRAAFFRRRRIHSAMAATTLKRRWDHHDLPRRRRLSSFDA